MGGPLPLFLQNFTLFECCWSGCRGSSLSIWRSRQSVWKVGAAGRCIECGRGEKGRRRKGGRALPAGLVGPTASPCYTNYYFSEPSMMSPTASPCYKCYTNHYSEALPRGPHAGQALHPAPRLLLELFCWSLIAVDFLKQWNMSSALPAGAFKPT